MAVSGIVEAIVREYRLNFRGTHGARHWLRVRTNGLALADATPDADREVIELFALLHDSQRLRGGLRTRQSGAATTLTLGFPV